MGILIGITPGAKGTPLGDVLKEMNLDADNDMRRSQRRNVGKQSSFNLEESESDLYVF